MSDYNPVSPAGQSSDARTPTAPAHQTRASIQQRIDALQLQLQALERGPQVGSIHPGVHPAGNTPGTADGTGLGATQQQQHTAFMIGMIQQQRGQHPDGPHPHTTNQPVSGDGWELPPDPTLSKRQQKKLRRQLRLEAEARANGGATTVHVGSVVATGEVLSKRQLRKLHRRQEMEAQAQRQAAAKAPPVAVPLDANGVPLRQQLAAGKEAKGSKCAVQVTPVPAPAMLSTWHQRKLERAEKFRSTKSSSQNAADQSKKQGKPPRQQAQKQSTQTSLEQVPFSSLSKRQQKKLLRKQEAAVRKAMKAGANVADADVRRPTDLPDDLVLDSPSDGKDTATLNDGMKVGFIIGGIVCVVSSIIMCTVFGVVGLLDMKPFPFPALGPIALMILGVILLGCIKNVRLQMDRHAMTLKHDRNYLFFICCSSSTVCELRSYAGTATTVSSIKVNGQRMMKLSARFGGDTVSLGVTPVWGAEAVRLKWHRYFEWSKAQAGSSS